MLEMAPAIIPGAKILRGTAIPFMPKTQAQIDSGTTDTKIVRETVSIKVRFRYPDVMVRRSTDEDAAATSDHSHHD